MILTQREISVIRPENNYVFVREIKKETAPENRDLARLKSGLYLDTSYNPACHQNVLMEVIMPPMGLIYDNRDIHVRYPGSMEWKTNLDVRVGDKVLVKYFTALNGIKCEGADGEIYHFIPYGDIILILRNQDPIMLNGYVAVLMAKEVQEFGEHKSEKVSTEFGKVIHYGEPNKEYQSTWRVKKGHQNENIPCVGERANLAKSNEYIRNAQFFREDRAIDDDYITKGNVVCILGKGHPTIEYEYWSELDGGSQMIAVQRRKIACIIKKDRQLMKNLEYNRGKY